ncbi:hypothetical protein F5J12DRAFT_916469 [Pisolithus orientalis]|uniref:uncharacterized protein n=1 Tax=Pisolithus orientalis TaxID=936130 RepID=UPI0022254A7C|nr:uncharacterized protein F5J12DRAFT_916469 [Pisolithus orientalis]KAI5983447.1 hypothetical protein F5J12DRAFT_916469 [Pisolithus orientalis]
MKALSNSKTAVGCSIKITNMRLPPNEDEDKDDTNYHELAAATATDSPIASHQPPKTCPGMDCKDAIPDNISDQLKTALSTYLEALKVTEAKGWPATKIEFKDIPSRILEMYDELEKLLFDVEARENLWLWTFFEADLELFRHLTEVIWTFIFIDFTFYSVYRTADIGLWYSLIHNNPLMLDCQVIRVSWYKKRKEVEHEFLRFDISSPENQHTSIVIAERSGGGVRSTNSGTSAHIHTTQVSDTIAQTDTAVDTTVSPLTPLETSALSPDASNSTGSSANENSPLSKQDAYDRVYFACILVQQAFGAKPTANELATLLYVTLAQEPKYNLQDTQCYWFATTVFDTLKMLYKGAKPDPTPHLGGTICGVPVDVKASGEEVCAKLKQEQKEQRQQECEQHQAMEEATKRAEEERHAAEERAQAAEEERQKECQATEEATKWE